MNAMANEIPTLRTVLKTYPHTRAIKSGELSDPRVRLDCLNVDPIYRAFAPMARQQAYDVSEMAIVTYLQAKAYGKPLVLLPTVVAARLQQGCLVYDARHGQLTLDKLRGARIGVRAYSQTTGMWVRGILAETYGVDVEAVNWITFEDAHLEEYIDPPIASRAPAGKTMLGMLLDGEIDAAIFGNDLPADEWIRPVIPDPAAADQAWYARHRQVPINHVVVMRRDVAERYPGAAQAVYELLERGKAAAPPQPADRLPSGVDALRERLGLVLDFCTRQKLLPRPLSLDEILADSLAFIDA
jgi:4,5-dihydroxyphthalate decarboxylase